MNNKFLPRRYIVNFVNGSCEFNHDDTPPAEEYLSLWEHEAILREQLATQAKRLSEAEAKLARKDEVIRELDDCRKAQVDEIASCHAELDALKAQLAVAVSALRKIMDQPFQGDWDMQARFVCDALAKLESKGAGEMGE